MAITIIGAAYLYGSTWRRYHRSLAHCHLPDPWRPNGAELAMAECRILSSVDLCRDLGPDPAGKAELMDLMVVIFMP